MSYLYCAGVLTVDLDGKPVCDHWEARTEQQVFESSGVRLSHDDYRSLSVFVIGCFVAAYGVRVVLRMFEARVLRE